MVNSLDRAPVAQPIISQIGGILSVSPELSERSLSVESTQSIQQKGVPDS
jgi:hypothetical protein